MGWEMPFSCCVYSIPIDTFFSSNFFLFLEVTISLKYFFWCNFSSPGRVPVSAHQAWRWCCCLMMTCRCQRLKLTLQSESPMSGVRSCCPKSTSLSFMPLRRCTAPAYRSHVSAMANYGKYTPYTLYLVPDARCPMPYAQELTFASATVSSRCTRTPHTKYEIQKYLSLSSRWRHTPRGVWRVGNRAREMEGVGQQLLILFRFFVSFRSILYFLLFSRGPRFRALCLRLVDDYKITYLASINFGIGCCYYFLM